MQKYVETLDLLKSKNTAAPPHQQGGRHSFENSLIDLPPNAVHQRRSSSGAAPIVITTQWETFDSIPVSFIPGGGGGSAAAPSTSQTSFTWDLL